MLEEGIKKRKLILLIVVLSACKKPYNPPASSSPQIYLVVEGVINAGVDTSFIKLSRTVNLSEKTTSSPESGAVVTLEDDKADSYPLNELGRGEYALPGSNLNTSLQYRLRIKTSDGKEYLSTYEIVKTTPPIDSVGFKIQNNGIQLYVNTHDPANKTRYYRWDYQETWQFHSQYGSSYITNGTSIVARTPDQLVYNCFGNDTSSTILLGSTARLTSDIIYQNPLIQIPATSEKVETRYSILVREYALTADAFNFWSNLKKNTEQLGSIFDAQPSSSSGDIYSTTNPSDIVLGYFSITNIQYKRIFIDNRQLPSSFYPTYPYQCELDSNLFATGAVVNNLIPLGSYQIPITAITAQGGVAGYVGSSNICVDCTLRGTKATPSFWKY